MQEFLLNNYTFCMNRMTHEFYLVPLQDIQGKIIRVDNSPDISDVFEKNLYTYIDCRDTEQIKDFCLRNPQVLSFVTVVGDLKPNVIIVKINSIDDIKQLQELLSANNAEDKKEENIEVKEDE